jgi:predicted DNA-binding helix-hairpin-helix protein
MDLEPAEDTGCPKLATRTKDVFISEAVIPGGKRIPLLKTLLTSACERNCFYCPFRAGRDFHRATFQPEELAKTFMNIHRAGIARGIFLSSGIVAGGIRTQDKLIDTADILRNRLGYRGYLHLKVMPGAEKAQVERAMQLADRISVNLEAPNGKRLELLAPRKEFAGELLEPLRWIEEIRRNRSPHLSWNGRWPSSVTQFVVGAVGESDLELLDTADLLFNQLHLRRTYFSAFRPIPNTPLENQPAESPQREFRLYQASFLLRDYGYRLDELHFENGNLPLDADPKLAWARQHLLERPLEINHASPQELLRIPGIGPKGVEVLLSARRYHAIKDISQLGKAGINTSKAAPFILLDGSRPPFQASFW